MVERNGEETGGVERGLTEGGEGVDGVQRGLGSGEGAEGVGGGGV
jgi:hypothetical protein